MQKRRIGKGAPPGEHIKEPQNTTLLLIEQLTKRIWIDSRNRYMRADTKYYESQNKKEQATVKVSVFISGFRRKILGHV